MNNMVGVNEFAAWWEDACATWVPWLLAAVVTIWLVSVLVYHVERAWSRRWQTQRGVGFAELTPEEEAGLARFEAWYLDDGR